MTAPYREDAQKMRRLVMLNDYITIAVYILYIVMLVVLLVMRDDRFLAVLAVPAVSFFLLSAVRRIINAKRPYEVWDITPLIEKDTKGKSFPSRHVFSIYMIAMAAMYLCLPLGIVLLIAGIPLAYSRVIGGVHFTRDVLAGAAVGVVLGILGFWVLPIAESLRQVL